MHMVLQQALLNSCKLATLELHGLHRFTLEQASVGNVLLLHAKICLTYETIMLLFASWHTGCLGTMFNRLLICCVHDLHYPLVLSHLRGQIEPGFG